MSLRARVLRPLLPAALLPGLACPAGAEPAPPGPAATARETGRDGKRARARERPARPSPFSARVRARAAREEAVEQSLSVEELKRVPGGQNDVIRAAQNLP